MRSARLLALAVLAPFGWGCGPARSPVATPSVLLVVVDTLRADHLGCYGYADASTPFVDALAAEGRLYERCTATAPWTLPTHASLFTGLHPFEHGARTFPVTEPVPNAQALHPEHATLAEFLSERGYATAAFVANAGYLSRGFGLDQGFQTYEVQAGPGSELNRLAVGWLDEQAARERPFFLFVNYMDAHRPYNTAPLEGLPDVPAEDPSRLLDELAHRCMASDAPIPAALRERVLAQYDRGIAHADRALAELWELLDARGLAEDTLVVVTSDHGEYFGEHRLVEHSKDVYEPALHVPLILRAPGGGGGTGPQRIAERVSSVDVPALVLEHLGAEVARAGADVFPYRPGNHPVVAENHFSRVRDLFHSPWSERFQRERVVLFDGATKWVESSDGRHELFDLERDPGEERNLLPEREERAEALSKQLRSFLLPRIPPDRESGAAPLGDETYRALGALGYL